MTDFGKRPVPVDHASRHQDGGIDELDAALLDGRINYVDRGDPSSFDFLLGDLTTDFNWYVLDLSSIVPSGAIAVIINVDLKDDAVSSFLLFRKYGTLNTINIVRMRTYVADIWTSAFFIVPCDSDRKIEYMFANTTFTDVQIVVSAWLI